MNCCSCVSMFASRISSDSVREEDLGVHVSYQPRGEGERAGVTYSGAEMFNPWDAGTGFRVVGTTLRFNGVVRHSALYSLQLEHVGRSWSHLIFFFEHRSQAA